MTSKEDEYREKIKILDSKDRELKERERILEQRIKDEHDKITQHKIQSDKELIQREQELLDKANSLESDKITALENQIKQLIQMYDDKLANSIKDYEAQLSQKDQLIGKIKHIKSSMDNENSDLATQFQSEKDDLEMQIMKLENINQHLEKQYNDKFEKSQNDIQSLEQSLKQSRESLEESVINNDRILNELNQLKSKVQITNNQMIQTDEQYNEPLQQQNPSNDLFITHTPDLETKPNIEQKYHILKKKLKKQKEQNAKYEIDMLELANLMDDIKFQTQQKLNNQSQTESKLRDLEVQLSRSQQHSKLLTIQINQLISDKELLQEKLQDKMTNDSQQIDPELLEEIKELREYKQEMNNLYEQLKIKMQRKKTKLIYLKETLDYKEQELQKKEIVLRKISQSQEESQKQLKQTALKLRQLEQTKLKDLKRKCSAQEDLIIQLQNRIKQYVGDAESTSQSPGNRKGSMKRNITQNHRQIKEVDEVLESTGKEFFNGKASINLHSLSNEDIHDKSSSYGKSNLLPEIGNQAKIKGQNGSIRSSVDRLPKAKKGNSHGPTYQDSYDRQVDSFVSRLKDPVYKNNSNNMQGVFSINQNQSHIIADTRNEDVTYDSYSIGGRGTISSRDDKIRRILEGTEQYEKLLYFTPEKSQLPRKMIQNRKNQHQPFDVGKESRDQKFRNRNIINK